MMDAAARARIRRLFYAEHWRIGTISAELGVHHDAVRNAINADLFVSRGTQVRPTQLDPYKGLIAKILEDHPRLRATRIFQMIRARGYEGSVVQLRRYVHKTRPTQAEAYLRLTTLPGEQAQVDWGHFGKIQVGSAKRTLWCFVFVLAWSRAMYARFMLDATLEAFMRGHVLAFEALGGVPREILYDNLKSVVLERAGDHIRFHPRILDLAGYYCFAPKPCAPYRGNEKGKVERLIQYLRHSFFAARQFSSVEDLNAQLQRWIAEVAHVRRAPGHADGHSVAARLADEQPRLLPLPEHAMPCGRVFGASSGKTPYVRFDLNDYSIPHTLVRKPLTLVAEEHSLRILDGDAEVARHTRSYDRAKVIEIPAHIATLAREKRRAHDLRGRDLLRNACKHADALLDALALRGDSLAGHTSQLTKLLDRYGAAELDRAIAEALSRGAPGAASVAHILDQRARARKAVPVLDAVLPDDPRVRDLRVTPHLLASYDELYAPPAASATFAGGSADHVTEAAVADDDTTDGDTAAADLTNATTDTEASTT
jgi:transposase